MSTHNHIDMQHHYYVTRKKLTMLLVLVMFCDKNRIKYVLILFIIEGRLNSREISNIHAFLSNFTIKKSEQVKIVFFKYFLVK